MGLESITTFIHENIFILIGLFVPALVMGTATLYDNYKSGNKNSLNLQKLKLPSNITLFKDGFNFKGFSENSSIGDKISAFIQDISKKVEFEKTKLEKTDLKALKPKDEIPTYLENLKNKLSALSFTSPEKSKSKRESQNKIQAFLKSIKNKLSALSFTAPEKDNKKKEASKKLDFSAAETSTFEETDSEALDLDKIVESKKDELDFEDGLLTEMSTESGLSNAAYEINKVETFSEEPDLDFDDSLSSDLKIDDSDFDLGFGEFDNEASDDLEDSDEAFSYDDMSVDTDELSFEDDSDNLIASLKKDIVVKKEEKIDFMAEMRGENLDVKLLKSELEDVLGDLKKYGRYSAKLQSRNHN